MRGLRILRHASAYRTPLTASRGDSPYARVLKMLQSDREGPPATLRVFEEFRAFYRAHAKGVCITSMGEKPLCQFCGSCGDAELFALMMMKVLCDLYKYEELRFLFAQCLLEFVSPTVELFNVYLLALSLGDSFNEYEMENVIEAMRSKGVEADVVTKISLFILYTRLGEDYSCWWPSIREEVRLIITSGEGWRERFPLLLIRLQHCFQTLLRVHHDAVIVHECFELLRTADPGKVTTRLLVPYILLSTNNAASPPSVVVQLIEAAESAMREGMPAPQGAGAGVSDERSGSTPLEPRDAPVLNNEVTALKLMAKCAKSGDVVSASYFLKYLRANPSVICAQYGGVLALLHLETLVCAGLLQEALYFLESEVPEHLCEPGPRPKLFVEAKRLTLLNAHPVMSLARFIAEVDTRVEESLMILVERKTAGGGVSHKSLNAVLAACALTKDEQKASLVLSSFRNLRVQYTARTFVLRLSTSASSGGAVRKLGTCLTEMADLGVGVTPEFMRVGLELALDAQDVSAAMLMVQHHSDGGVSIDSKLSARLFKMLSLVADVESVRKLLAVLRVTRSPIDPRCLSLCRASFKKWGIPCDDLEGTAPSTSTH